MIYEASLVQDRPIEIKRRPARFWCRVGQQWSLVDLYDPSGARQSHQKHRDCLKEIQSICKTDLCSTSNVHLHQSHFPCPKLLDKSVSSNMGLGFLQACRQVYKEARHIAYLKNTFLVCDLSAFSNFLYCLKAWQVESIGHLAFEIAESYGMTIFLAEWNDTFSLLAASFRRLQTVSVTVQLMNMPHIWGSTFWDAGLLELDRINLKSARFIIVDGNLKRQFVYTAGKKFFPSTWTPTSTSFISHHAQNITNLVDPELEPEPRMIVVTEPTVSFHRCRDRLRGIHSYDPENEADTKLFFRFARSPFPLYVWNLVHLIPQRTRSDHTIQWEDCLQRSYLPYKYAHRGNMNGTGEDNRVFGYQYTAGLDRPNDDEIDRNVLNVHLARQRLEAKLHAGNTTLVKPPARPASVRPIQRQRSSNQLNHMNSHMGLIDFSPPGYWRRRLYEEVYSPLFESFPHRTLGHIDRVAWKCHECGIPATGLKCFATS